MPTKWDSLRDRLNKAYSDHNFKDVVEILSEVINELEKTDNKINQGYTKPE